MAEVFGDRDPWNRITGGLDRIIAAFADVTVKPDEYPDGDLPIDAVLLGTLTAASSLSSVEQSQVLLYMQLAREGHVTFFKSGVQMAAQELGATNAAGKASAVRPADAKKIEKLTGFSWQESTAGALAMALLKVPSRELIEAWGWGQDPVDHASFKSRRKMGQKQYLDFISRADAVALRMALKRTARALHQEGWTKYSACLNQMIEELSECTIDEGVPRFFVDYFEEFMELWRHRGLILDTPLDADILRRKVLARRGEAANANGQAAGGDARQAERDRQMAEVLRMTLRTQSQLASLADRVDKIGRSHPKEDGGDGGGGGAGPSERPGADNKCFECGSTEHFGYNCEKRKARLEAQSTRKGKAVVVEEV